LKLIQPSVAVVNESRLQLDDFLPYRLSVLANTLSSTLASAYSRRFDLRIPEWRVLAVLGHYPGSSARQLAERTAMDKVAVSRAVASLIQQGRILSRVDSRDRRRTLLRLSARGEALLTRIAPLARAYEARLLESLDSKEKAQLAQLLDKLLDQAMQLHPATEERSGLRTSVNARRNRS
jgi:DNA-binding MarR family transcriptional regulator